MREETGVPAADLLVVSALPGGPPALAAAACLAVAAAGGGERGDGPAVALVDLEARSAPRPGLLASAAARSLETLAAEELPELTVRARGAICHAAAVGSDGGLEGVAALLRSGLVDVLVVATPPALFRPALELGAEVGSCGVLVQADRSRPAPLLGLLAAELRRQAVPHKVWSRPPGRIGARRALAGLDPGGEVSARSLRHAESLLGRGPGYRPSAVEPLPDVSARPVVAESGQALPGALGMALAVVVLALALVAIGSGATAKGRAQRAVDLAALSAARSMRDDFPRLFVPALRADGSPNPEHLGRAEYLQSARRWAERAARENGLEGPALEVSFPDADSFAPLRVAVRAEPTVAVDGPPPERRARAGEAPRVELEAVAELHPPGTTQAAEQTAPEQATGGGYSGPLEIRQGKPMRPDVAATFDRMAATAAADGLALIVNSGFRSDAEQARLFAANPDPRWVAPPGQSLHRCATELDLGPASAYGWLAANAGRFGFVQRYPWEPWHYGFEDGPAPCSTAGDRIAAGGESGGEEGDGRSSAGPGLPGFVPAAFREPLLRAAAAHDVPAALLAAQLMAESNFNPAAVSPAGAQGIAQFMPATAAAYGLDDPFDAAAAIEAQARLMSDLLGQFGQVSLALAAYNAGPAPVAACDCVPAYPETEAYVARILGLLDGAGELATPAPALEVRLVA